MHPVSWHSHQRSIVFCTLTKGVHPVPGKFKVNWKELSCITTCKICPEIILCCTRYQWTENWRSEALKSVRIEITVTRTELKWTGKDIEGIYRGMVRKI
jgi:hypothetical protein